MCFFALTILFHDSTTTTLRKQPEQPGRLAKPLLVLLLSRTLYLLCLAFVPPPTPAASVKSCVTVLCWHPAPPLPFPSMGCLFSSDDPAGAASAPLLDAGGPSPPLRFTKAVSEAALSGAPASAAPSAAAKKLPTFKRPVQPSAAPARAAQPGVGLFCSCGGPGSLVELLPCRHHALCLSCAQQRTACPVCAAPFTDSNPPFRTRAPAPAEAL
jgi:hypothetical protein